MLPQDNELTFKKTKTVELIDTYAYQLLELNTPIGVSISAASKLETLNKEITNLYKDHKMKRADLEKYLISAKKVSELLLMYLSEAAKHSNSPQRNTELILKNLKTTKLAVVELFSYSLSKLITAASISVSAASKLETLTKEITQLYEEHTIKRADLEKYLNSSQKISKHILEILGKAAELVHSSKQVAVDYYGRKRTFEVKEYLNEILTTLRPAFKCTKPKVLIVCEEQIVLSSYPGSFAQLITNLIVNSMIHGFALPPENGKKEWQINIVVITTPSTENELEKNLILRYSDNGKGIHADIINGISNRQSDNSGLGLHIVYNLVTHKLKGTISCESVEGEGTTFIISIPISV